MKDRGRASGLLARLVVISLLTGAAVGTFGVTLLHASAQRVLRGQSLRREEEVAQRVATLLDTHVASIVDSLRVMASNISVATLSPGASAELDVLLRVVPTFEMLELIDAAGRPRAAAATRSLVDPATLAARPELTHGLQAGGFGIHTLLVDRPEAEIDVPVENPPGTVVGALLGDVSVDDLAAPVEGVHLAPGGVAFLTDPAGRILAHPDLSLVVNRQTFPVGRVLTRGATSGAQPIRDHGSTLAGVAAAQVFPGDVVVEVPESGALAPASRTSREFSVILALVVGAILAGIVLASRALLQGLSPLAAAVRRFGAGDFRARAASKGPAEIGLLATEFNRMADGLAEAFERERAVMETAQDAIFEVSLDGRIERLNPGFTRMFGWDVEEWIGKPFDGLVHPDQAQPPEQGVRDFVDSGADPRNEVRILTKSGDYRVVESIAVPRMRGDEVVGVLGIARDISERKKAEDALRRSEQAYADAFAREREAADRLREIDRVKDEFLATASHELRTPLAAVIGFATLLIDRNDRLDSATRSDLLARVRRNAEGMHQLVEQLLDLTAAKAKKATAVDRRPLTLRPVIAACLDRLSPILTDHDLHVAVPNDIRVVADPTALDHIVGNLISNAAKYAPSGSSVELIAEADHGFVRISVSDEGPGIPEAGREHLFESFYRVPGRSSDVRGAGLGLSIVQRYVDQLGGKVWVESEEGHGSTFTFTVPSCVDVMA